MMRLIFALAALLLPVAAQARDTPEWVQVRDGAPVTLRADRAYILYRTVRMDGVSTTDTVFLREPDAAEVSAYEAARDAEFVKAKAKRDAKAQQAEAAGRKAPPEITLATFIFDYDSPPNVYRVKSGAQYDQSETENVYLVEVKPASYVIAGQAFKMLINTQTCMCLGTVRFEAKPGVITDLGHLLSDDVAKVSPIPELAEVTGRGARINGVVALMVSTVRPDAETASVPEPLRALARVPADLRAVGKFPNRFAASVNRMAPIPGILAYEDDRVIDVKAMAE